MPNIIEPARQFGNALLDFVYPNVCFHCNARVSEHEVLICRSCWTELPRNRGHTLSPGDKKLTRTKHFAFLAWRFVFNDAVRKLIHLFKFGDYPFLYERLGLEMAETVNNVKELARADALVPVPLHRARLRERGYNQSLLLALVVSDNTDIPVVNALERIKNSRPQASIEGDKKKEDNVKGIFAAKNNVDIENKRFILVDDIFTSGATVNECSKVLKHAAAREVMVLTAAFATLA